MKIFFELVDHTKHKNAVRCSSEKYSSSPPCFHLLARRKEARAGCGQPRALLRRAILEQPARNHFSNRTINRTNRQNSDTKNCRLPASKRARAQEREREREIRAKADAGNIAGTSKKNGFRVLLRGCCIDARAHE